DHHNQEIDLIVREKTQAKNVLKDLSHINLIHYNNFRKGIFYWIDVVKLIWIYVKNKYNYIYILDKVNKPAIAAKICGIKNIIGPGIGSQKKWLTVKNYLTQEDLSKSYSEQSQKMLSINSISIKEIYPKINIDLDKFKSSNPDLVLPGKKISFGIDSFEDYKMWYEESFIELADYLYKKKLFEKIYLICGQEKSYLADNIINLSNKNYFINCSNKDLGGIIFALKNSDFFVGNNSGPLNLSAALGVQSFGLIANDPIDELKYSKIQIITPDNYNNSRYRYREGMKKLTVERVFRKIMEKIN
ncbi:lipopolysaccharide heptosyltransferase family protein, partial [Candidatus Pelagibacter sp.]|nr:lipopolysaccharide heptosyltransferase family protein [Candidatus Pelagibacter sp.]